MKNKKETLLSAEKRAREPTEGAPIALGDMQFNQCSSVQTMQFNQCDLMQFNSMQFK